VQTFLPYSSFGDSAKCLDYRRLGKQRVEAFQLLVAIGDEWALDIRAQKGLTSPAKGWTNHPAARMWYGHERSLGDYMNKMIEEWLSRGYNNTMPLYTNTTPLKPSWFGDLAFHASHRSNLLRKDISYYSQFDWGEPPDLPYVWPK
jgi:hypothetical protein